MKGGEFAEKAANVLAVLVILAASAIFVLKQFGLLDENADIDQPFVLGLGMIASGYVISRNAIAPVSDNALFFEIESRQWIFWSVAVLGGLLITAGIVLAAWSLAVGGLSWPWVS